MNDDRKPKTTLQRVLEQMVENGDIGGSVRSYSGRGMYGRNCVGFVPEQSGNGPRLGLKIALFMMDAGSTEDKPIEAVGEEIEQVIREMRGEASDSMGLDSIVYWPYAGWSEGLINEEE